MSDNIGCDIQHCPFTLSYRKPVHRGYSKRTGYPVLGDNEINKVQGYKVFGIDKTHCNFYNKDIES